MVSPLKNNSISHNMDPQEMPGAFMDQQQAGIMMGADGQPRDIIHQGTGEEDVDFNQYHPDQAPQALSEKEQMKICNEMAKKFGAYPTNCSVAKRVGLIFAAIFSFGLALISKNIRVAIFHGLTLNKVDGSLIKESVSQFSIPINKDLEKNLKERCNAQEYFGVLATKCEERFGRPKHVMLAAGCNRK